jgi:hypothetical protein
MRKLFIALLILGAFGSAAKAQTPHTATLTWKDGGNVGTVTYSIYRATGLCSGSPVFSKIATGITGLTYVDSSVVPGNYCFQVTATMTGIESSASVAAGKTITPFPPTNFNVQ